MRLDMTRSDQNKENTLYSTKNGLIDPKRWRCKSIFSNFSYLQVRHLGPAREMGLCKAVPGFWATWGHINHLLSCEELWRQSRSVHRAHVWILQGCIYIREIWPGHTDWLIIVLLMNCNCSFSSSIKESSEYLLEHKN